MLRFCSKINTKQNQELGRHIVRLFRRVSSSCHIWSESRNNMEAESLILATKLLGINGCCPLLARLVIMGQHQATFHTDGTSHELDIEVCNDTRCSHAVGHKGIAAWKMTSVWNSASWLLIIFQLPTLPPTLPFTYPPSHRLEHLFIQSAIQEMRTDLGASSYEYFSLLMFPWTDHR